MNPVIFTGGARVGESYWSSINYSWPLASLTIRQGEISLTMPLKSVALSRDQVIRINDYRGIISDGIQIQHSSKDTPSFLVFWTSQNKVADELKAAGYPYQEPANRSQPTNTHPALSAMALILILTFVFLFVLMNEYRMARETPDAILNATGLTLFLGLVLFFLRRRILR